MEVFFTDYNTTPTKVVFSCFGLLVGLWQLDHSGCQGQEIVLSYAALNLGFAGGWRPKIRTQTLHKCGTDRTSSYYR